MSNESDSNEYDLGTGLHIITLTYHDDPEILPEIDLGDCSPWVAVTLLKAAAETIDLVIPPINLSYKGDRLIEHGIIDDSGDYEEED